MVKKNETVKQSTTNIYAHNDEDQDEEVDIDVDVDDEVENVDVDVDNNGEQMMVVEESTATTTASTEIIATDKVKNDNNSSSSSSSRTDNNDNDNNNNSGIASKKLKCLKCSRSARKDCMGSLCIRCCLDDTCSVHKEQRAKTLWKESVMNGTSEIQLLAKAKRLRAIPKKRFKEIEFKYMNDTVLLWDLRSVVQPSYPLPTPTIIVPTTLPLPTTLTTATNSNSTTGSSTTTTIVYAPPSPSRLRNITMISKLKMIFYANQEKMYFKRVYEVGIEKEVFAILLLKNYTNKV